MGIGIAAVLLMARYRVEVVESDPEACLDFAPRLALIFVDAERRGKTKDWRARTAGLLTMCTALEQTSPAPTAVIEAVPEALELKRRVLAEAEELEPRLLASNTSAISIDSLAEGISRPESFIGMHFFNPVPAMALVELIVGDRTDSAALDIARTIVSDLGKESVEVRDSPGFASSRLGVLLGIEAIRMVEEGVAAPADIDRAMELGYRHPVGPLRLSDIVGLDVRLAIARRLQDAYGEQFEPPPLMLSMVEAGDLGKKSGRGFYEWPDS